jgi:hypothetical protein
VAKALLRQDDPRRRSAVVPQPDQGADAAPPAPLPPTPADLAATIDTARGATGLSAAMACAAAVLTARAAAGDPWAPHLGRLLAMLTARLDVLPPLHDLPRIPVHYDDRVAHYFEQLVALLRIQDAQMAELRAIIAELV